MYRIILLLIVVIPITVFPQQDLVKFPPLEFMWKYVGNQGFSAGDASYPSLAFSPNGEPYISFEDGANSSKTTVMKFDGTNWVIVGNAGISLGMVAITSLAFSLSGEPYVAYSDGGYFGKASVMKFDGTNWVNVGNTGFSSGVVDEISLAFSPSDGIPYVAFTDWENSHKATVMKFDGSNWVIVGNAGFSEGAVAYTSLSCSLSGEPYVAYRDAVNSYKATVMKFNGTAWVNVGSNGFSAGQAEYTNLAINSSGTPYVAYEDHVNSHKATVMKFDGSNWVNVGNAGFSVDTVICISLAFSPSGEPYVAYVAYSPWFLQAGKATVMKFNEVNWVNVGIAGFSASSVYYTSLAFSPMGQPYVAYQDWAIGSKATVMKFDSVYVGIHKPQKSQINCYPNPVTTILTIESADNSKISKVIRIYEIIGNLIYETESRNDKIELNVESFPAGMYIVKVASRNSNYESKFLKY